MNLSIVIPAYNEEKRIGGTIQKIADYMRNKQYKYEILVIDDGSQDKTISVAQNLKNKRKDLPITVLPNKVNRGKGYSVRKGMLAAKYGWILFTDADLSTPIEELDKFLPHLDYDIIIGSRRQEDSSIEIKQPWYRSIPGKVFPLIVNALVLRGVRDTQCGFKLFRKNVAHFLFKKQQLEGFSFDAEILWLAKRKQYSIKEIGVVWINDLDSKLHPIKDSYNMFMELLKIKYNLLKGLYR
jgi:dolichyl-phosphate beta-glucosyltransferase